MSETRVMTLTDFLLARIAEDEARFAATPYDARMAASPDGNEGYIVELHERLRAESEAKRRIVELHSEDEEGGGLHICHDMLADETECGELRALASVYAEHPDYRREWKP